MKLYNLECLLDTYNILNDLIIDNSLKYLLLSVIVGIYIKYYFLKW